MRKRPISCKEARQMVMPYINDELTDKELEVFLAHVSGCSECYEELEIYYTIYAGLAQLDGGGEVGDISGLLSEALRVSDLRVKGRHALNFCFVFSQILAVAALAAVFVLEIMKIL